jgi:hypothetical protein
MALDSGVDRRTRRFGRVVAFRVFLPDSDIRDLKGRDIRLTRAPYEVESNSLSRPGFEVPQVVRGVLCSRYVEDVERSVEWLGEIRIEHTLRYTSFYDMLGDGRRGYILVGRPDLADAHLGLALYLETLGINPEDVAAEPLVVSDLAMKRVFFDPRVTRKALKASTGITDVTLRTGLPELTQDRYYQILQEAGIDDEPWHSCEFVPPAIRSAQKAPPRIHLRSEGFTVRSSYLIPGNWHYVEWLIRCAESAARAAPVLRQRVPTLFDGYWNTDASEPAI